MWAAGARSLMYNFLLTLVLVVALSGCAGTRMRMPQLSPVTKAAMQERFDEGIPPSLNLPSSARTGFARQTGDRIHASAIRLCRRVFGSEHGCGARLARYRLVVRPGSSVVNAHIDLHNNITVYGGLIRRVGSSDELAAVLAHEYAHGIMGHVGRKMRNVIGASLIGMAVGAVVGAATEDPDDGAGWARLGQGIGTDVGIRVYSQAMENEADHLGLFILHDAGYNPKAASHFHMRLLNERRFVRNSKQQLGLLYMRTHPGSEERIQKLMSTEQMIESGHERPLWKK